MWEWVDSAGTVLFDATLSTALFLSLVVVAMLVCRQPTRRLLIARVALFASLAMIPLVALVPLPRLDLLDTLVQTDILPNSLILELETGGNPKPGSIAPEQKSHPPFAHDLHDRILSAGRWLPRSLTLIDLAFVAMGTAWLMLGFWGVQWLIRHSRSPSAATTEIFDRLFADGAKKPGCPALRVSPRVRHPVIAGFFHPTILIPTGLDESDDDRELLRLSLLHEIAHADQADPWFGTIASLAQTVWFFLPQIWWLRSQLLIDQEFLADRTAALRYGTSCDYASSLLSLAEDQPGLPREAGPSNEVTKRVVLAESEVGSPLSQRVLMLLYCPFRVETRVPRSWSWALRITLAAATVVAACMCIRWPDAAALEHRQSHGPGAKTPQFRVTDFTSEPLVFSKDGRVVSYVMPVALPSQYVLSVDVLSTPLDLAKVRIAGHPLGSAADLQDQDLALVIPAMMLESWHHVQLVREGDRISLSIDGQTIAVCSSPQATTEWLTFEPSPTRVTQFRDLVVEW
jgi:beta-lactamase regulating signal transducer with metallopeptidase domain